jgi:conjugal transfer pilus assembly protein TraB
MLLGAGVGSAFSILCGIGYSLIQSEPSHEDRIQTRDLKISLPGPSIDKKDIWMSQVESQAKLQNQKIETLEKMIVREVGEGDTTVDSLKQEVQALRDQIKAMTSGSSSSPSSNSNTNDLHQTPWNEKSEVSSNSSHSEIRTNRGVQKIVVNLQNKLSKQRNAKNFLPAGSFAKAALIGSVDANCGVSSTSDPKPVLLRLLEDGKLPNKFTSKLKRCVVVGAAHGDISSERVDMRLERMSCIDRKTGEVIELAVTGYVAGEDGKAGVRGEVVDRSGSMMTRAAIGGFFGGISQYMQGSVLSQQMAHLSREAGGQSLLSMDSLKQGGIQGAGSALDKLSEYYIKRAEQLQPVIQIGAGRTVDVVFTQGVKIAPQQPSLDPKSSSLSSEGSE